MPKQKSLLTWIVGAVLIALSVFIVVKFNASTTPTSDLAVVDEITSADWTQGTPDSAVTLIEYGDFQCPACAGYLEITKVLVKEFGNHITFAFRNFPLRSIHQFAQLGAQAAESAGNQGQFWEMHDLLFENQKDWTAAADPEVKLIEYATDLGLDVERFKTDLHASATEEAVNADYNSGLAAGVNSTPTFFLNGQRVVVRNFDEFRSAIRDAITAASSDVETTE